MQVVNNVEEIVNYDLISLFCGGCKNCNDPIEEYNADGTISRYVCRYNVGTCEKK